MIHYPEAPVNTSAPTSHTAPCDTCTRPIGNIAPITIADTPRHCCRFCRHNLLYAKIGNILRLIDRFFVEGVTA